MRRLATGTRVIAGMRVVVGTRGSALARRQTQRIVDRIHTLCPDRDVRIEIIKTKGDRIVDTPLAKIGGKGLFTKEIETALLDERIDLAVHSLKDLPVEMPDGLAVVVPEREDPSDAFVSVRWPGLDALPEGATVGTSSLRRRAQLLAYRPDLNVVDLRGNVDTRIRRVEEGDMDAAILATAGLRRMERGDAIRETLSPDIMLPAPGQGALAIQYRPEDAGAFGFLEALTDSAATLEVENERALLAALGGGCQLPLGALARVDAATDMLRLRARVATLDGARCVEADVALPLGRAKEAWRDILDELLAGGVREILESVLTSASKDGSAEPLFGKRVAVTRAVSQSDALTNPLRRSGACVYEFPTIEIEPVPVQMELEDITRHDWLVLTSANAVEALFAEVPATSLASLKTAAVGPATAEVLQARGIRVDVVPNKQTAEGLVEALLQHIGDVRGKRFLWPRAEKARDLLVQALHDRGATVTEYVVYRTVKPDVPDVRVDALMCFAPDIVVFTSPSTAKHFAAILGEARLDEVKKHAVFAAIGPVTADAVRQLGLEVAIEPDQHDIPGLIQAILAFSTNGETHSR